MPTRRALNHLFGVNYLKIRRLGIVKYYHEEGPNEEECLTPEFAFQKLNKMAQGLGNVDLVDGKLVSIGEDSVLKDEQIEQRIKTFKSVGRLYLGTPSVQKSLKKRATTSSFAATESIPELCFGRSDEREHLTLKTLTSVCSYLNVSSQQRKSVRLAICSQVNQHRIWTGALKKILSGLKAEIESMNYQQRQSLSVKEITVSEQIISRCFQFLSETCTTFNPDSTSWMRVAPSPKYNSWPSHRWEDLLDMFNDLIKCSKNEMGVLPHMVKLEIMKEGLYQIKDVLVDRDIGYREARLQESLMQKKLLKTLGHSSQCLFTLLLYYLYGNVRDLEIEVRGGVYKRKDKKNVFFLCIGKILTSDNEMTIGIGVKQLDKALGLFKFVWEAAEMKGVLELQGHLWCVGAEDRILTYRSNTFFLHAIKL
ncbi:hypothetical protein C5167_025388 [Papaver somniferum]|uniref:Uncharacterized protein n=1 Tax=Papaver somniferum TaxID=3469 RepID=A0A4Y7JVA5_PAPSO|nr:uncharacterized protein LOC113280460 [Papaver somniferum]RZC63645.1 hypothetical protein C5167_025388 [Papaver somniferum]